MPNLTDDRLHAILNGSVPDSKEITAMAQELRRRRDAEGKLVILTLGIGMVCEDEHWRVFEVGDRFAFQLASAAASYPAPSADRFEPTAREIDEAKEQLRAWRARSAGGNQVIVPRRS